MTNWTRDDFRVYLMLYAANVDLNISETEIDIIESKFELKRIKDIKSEFDADNDFQRIEKIEHHVKHNGCSENELNTFLEDTIKIFKADGHFARIELATFSFLKKLLAR